MNVLTLKSIALHYYSLKQKGNISSFTIFAKEFICIAVWYFSQRQRISEIYFNNSQNHSLRDTDNAMSYKKKCLSRKGHCLMVCTSTFEYISCNLRLLCTTWTRFVSTAGKFTCQHFCLNSTESQ